MPSGRIYKRGDKWYLDYSNGTSVEGKRHRVQCKAQGRTKAEAQAELDGILHSMRRAMAKGGVADNKECLSSVIDAWVQSISMRLAETAVVQYRHNVTVFKEALAAGGIMSCDQIAPRAIDSAMRDMMDQGAMPNTANFALKKLRQCFRWAVKNRVLAANPLDGITGVTCEKKKHRKALTRQEIEALLREDAGRVA